MTIKGLAECLKEYSLKSGVATDKDFEGISPLDIVASYCVSLSGGRITEERDIINRVNGCTSIDHFFRSVSRGKVPVPTLEQIEKVQSGELNEYVPPPPTPSKLDLAAKACLREYQRRDKLDAQAWGTEYTPIDMQKPWNGMLPQNPSHISNWDAHKVISWYVRRHGKAIYKYAGLQAMTPIIEKATPEEFVEEVSEPYKKVTL